MCKEITEEINPEALMRKRKKSRHNSPRQEARPSRSSSQDDEMQDDIEEASKADETPQGKWNPNKGRTGWRRRH